MTHVICRQAAISGHDFPQRSSALRILLQTRSLGVASVARKMGVFAPRLVSLFKPRACASGKMGTADALP